MTMRDPLGVLESTARVMASAQMVEIDSGRIAEIAGQLAGLDVPAPEWSELHPVGKNDDETANLVLVLDALNFCFWQMPSTDRKRWTVTWQGKPLEDSQITIEGPGIDGDIQENTDAQGQFRCVLPGEGLYSIRARFIEEVEGEHQGKPYRYIGHYSTLTLPYAPLQ